MEWAERGHERIADIGAMRLVSYGIGDEWAFSVLVLRGDEWEKVAWGTSTDRESAEEMAVIGGREVVCMGGLDSHGMGGLTARLALFSPVTGAELEQLQIRTREWAGSVCREIATAEIGKVRRTWMGWLKIEAAFFVLASVLMGVAAWMVAR